MSEPPGRGTCVYTVLLGGYERLTEQPQAERSGLPFICLTDDPSLTSRTWRMRAVEPLFPMDPIRSQRALKLMPHEALPEFAASLYIDNSVLLTQPPEALIEAFGDAPFGLPSHSYRQTVLDEFAEVARLGLDDQARIFEQLSHYMMRAPEALEDRPGWSAILWRRHDDDLVRRTMRTWLSHVLRYSRRDQLALTCALRATGLRPSLLDVDNFESAFHAWPRSEGRNREAGWPMTLERLMPAVRLRALEREADDLRAALDDERARSAGRACEAEALRERLAEASARADSLAAAIRAQMLSARAREEAAQSERAARASAEAALRAEAARLESEAGVLRAELAARAEAVRSLQAAAEARARPALALRRALGRIGISPGAAP